MKKLIILSIVLFFVFGIFVISANAAKPSDYGLKEGDLISAIFSDDPDVYIINDSGYKRLFLNPTIFNFYGHLGGFFNVKLVSTEVRDAFATSGLFRNCEVNDPKVYGVDIDGEDTGKLHWVNVSSENASSEDPEFFKKVFCINNSEFKWYAKGSEFKAVKDVPKYERMKEKATISTQEKIAEKAEIKNIGQSTICHYPPGNATAYQTITVSASALKAHLDHGDVVGVCPSVSPSSSITPAPTSTPTPTVSPSPTSTPTPIPASTSALEITSVSVVPNITSVKIEWQTNKPATSKVFISGGNLSSKVYQSESGLSTRHLVNISGLSSHTNYSYELESIAGDQVAKKQESFFTELGNISMQIDKTLVQLTNWNWVQITIYYTENGEPAPVEMSLSVPGEIKKYKITKDLLSCSGTHPFFVQIIGVTGGSCTKDGKVQFSYLPKTLGTHNITVNANGVTKAATVDVAPYVKTDPIISDAVNSNPVFEINSNYEPSLGSFKISQADESIDYGSFNLKYESDLQISGFLKTYQSGNSFALKVVPKTSTYSLPLGTHNVKITEIKFIGSSSGTYRYASGLPVIFTFEVKDIPTMEIIPIETTHSSTFINNAGNPPQQSPGVIGSFKIKGRPNGNIGLSCSIGVQSDNSVLNARDMYYLRVNKDEVYDAGCGGEVSIGANGISTSAFNIRVSYYDNPSGWALLNLSSGSYWVNFIVNGIHLTDKTSGIVKTFDPFTFKLEVVRP